MSPATGLLGYRDGCCCLFTWETFSPVDLDTCSSRNKSKMVEHKLASFATIAILTVYKQVFRYLNFANHRTKECFVSTANKPLVGTLMTI